MLEGLKEVEKALLRRNIKMVVQRGSPDEVALSLGKAASLVVADRGYLRIQKAWRDEVGKKLNCSAVQVEDNVVVPVDVVSDKREYAARTIRPKINEHREEYLVEHTTTAIDTSSLTLAVGSVDLGNPRALADTLKLEQDVLPVSQFFKGGTSQAKATFRRFLEEKFSEYDAHRDQPQTNDVSHMSKYLHFGQISPVYLVRGAEAATENIESFVEELVVRRELAMNFVNFTAYYDRYSCLPEWSRDTLEKHQDDKREHIYSRAQLENAETHDEYWNAAMNEMRFTGYMHNYMRMYWGKKIIE